MVNNTGLKVYGNGEWHARKHGANKRRIWRKLHLAFDENTHQIVGAELSTISVCDPEVWATCSDQFGKSGWRL
ncbi:transposase [Pseudoalteromonas sp. McH1-42]|uniref:transposase n=1 Tax=Pseudoalteromonas sp. McH1-42 TaxID=2917752 RepID=UPI001EF52767|nr:transposase [Pseudoalteromonas sp. McH1-42]MCG7564550.1 transposase [Pseudoalteromonas sp. McH1-42]